MLLYGVITVGLLALIFFGGARWFGRSSTQGWIDRLRRWPRVQAYFDRHHGAIRALFHYVEFGGLSLVLYLLLRAIWWPEGLWSWQAVAVTVPVCVIVAYLDEKRQELTPGRQFRMIDFYHSIRGLVGMQVIIALVAMVRWGLGQT